MASPAPHPDPGAGRGLTLAGPGEPVPVAFVGRTSTLELQDPVASLRRQVRSCQAACPPGWFIAAWYWDIESGGLDLEAPLPGRRLPAVRRRRDPPRRRHGRPARRGRQPDAPVRRGDLRGHRTVRPGHLQRPQTGEETVPAGHPGVRHRRADRHRRRQRHHRPGPPGQARRRRMVPAAAEGEDLERPGRARPGRVEHRPRPLRVPAVRVPHPVPVKASQGRTKTRLALDPARAPGGRSRSSPGGPSTSSACPPSPPG